MQAPASSPAAGDSLSRRRESVSQSFELLPCRSDRPCEAWAWPPGGQGQGLATALSSPDTTATEPDPRLRPQTRPLTKADWWMTELA